jgi:hypothetical protein
MILRLPNKLPTFFAADCPSCLLVELQPAITMASVAVIITAIALVFIY